MMRGENERMRNDGALHSRGLVLAGGFRYATLATFARSLPFRSPKSPPRSTGRSAEPPAAHWVPGRRAVSVPLCARPCARSLPVPLAVSCTLAKQAAGIQGASPSDPGIRGPLHPPRRRCPPSPYRCGYASVGRLAGCGASTLSVLGLFRNGPLDAGHSPLRSLAPGSTHGYRGVPAIAR